MDREKYAEPEVDAVLAQVRFEGLRSYLLTVYLIFAILKPAHKKLRTLVVFLAPFVSVFWTQPWSRLTACQFYFTLPAVAIIYTLLKNYTKQKPNSIQRGWSGV